MTKMDSTTMCSAVPTAPLITCEPAQWLASPRFLPSKASAPIWRCSFHSCASACSGFVTTARICSTSFIISAWRFKGAVWFRWSLQNDSAGFANASLMKVNFLSPHGIRALSRYYLDHPYTFTEARRNRNASLQPGGQSGGHVWWKFELARSRLDADELPFDRSAPEIRLLFRRYLQGRVSHR